MKLSVSSTFLFLAMTLSLFAKRPEVDHSQVDKPATLKVLLIHKTPKALIEAKGKYSLFNLDDNRLVESGLFGKIGEVLFEDGGIRWGHTHPLTTHLRLSPGDSNASFLVDGIEYKGCLTIRSHQNQLTIINEIDVETYLKTTLTPKFPNKLQNEVAEAIAIIARTNAYYFLKHAESPDWHITAKNADYHGYAFAFNTPSLSRAIEKTRHLILTYHGAPFPAFWTENCGGTTATYSSIFRKDVAVPPSIQAPFATQNRESNRWAFAVTKERLAKIVNAQAITGIELFCDKDSNKVYALRIKDGGKTHDISFSHLQLELGEQRLQSNDFTITPKRDHVIIQGVGKGLGMGLCLYTAHKMAERGETAPVLLKTFFPDSEITLQSSLGRE